MINLTLKQFRYFEALARHGHFGRAADACAISQPALSMQIKELEESLGTELFERCHRQIRLTSFGEEFALRIRGILRSVDELEDLARASHHRLVGRLRIGVIPTIAPYLLPTIIGNLTRVNVGLDLQIRETVTPKLLQELAEKDFLTGLLNRRAFTEHAERSWRQAQREKQTLGVVMMDVDFFKRYNDHYGHAAGDEALRQVARVIGEYARRPLDCTARYGGEEFVGIWYNLSEEQMLAILENLRRGIEALGLAHAYSDAAPVVTLSIGLAYLTPQPHQSPEDALRLADVALYLAKEQGRNRVVGKKPGGLAD